jgi:hypothetical protein
VPAITLYLHIGSGKTGTTAVQRFLAQNYSKLLEFGVLYPNFDSKDVFTPVRPDYWQGRYFEESDSSDDLELFNRCVQYCKENSLHSIIVSAEPLLVDRSKRVVVLANKLDANIKIICYVRRQDHYLEAIWKQWGHRYFSAAELLGSMDSKEWRGWRAFDWYAAIEPWAKNFGKENIIIRPYEKEQLPDGILPDFLDVVGIVWPEKPEVTSQFGVNLGFSRDVVEFLYLNKGLNSDKKDFGIYKMLDAVLDDNFRKKMFDPYEILSPEDRIEILKKYEASNQMLAREYLNRDDGRLFYEPWPDIGENSHSYPGMSVETLTPILTKILHHLYKQHENLNTAYQELAERQKDLEKQFQNLHEGQKSLDIGYQNLYEGQKNLDIRYQNLYEGQKNLDIGYQNLYKERENLRNAQGQIFNQQQTIRHAGYSASFFQTIKRSLSGLLNILRIRK